jgi:hypothetical protein
MHKAVLEGPGFKPNFSINKGRRFFPSYFEKVPIALGIVIQVFQGAKNQLEHP